jgi:HD-GYP domain-containing protein (c-di-GMP phosphodiesterase class II)
MRLVALQRLEEGAILARDVHTGVGGPLPLLARGAALDARRIVGLERAGIRAVYVDDALSEGVDVTPALSEETRAKAVSALGRALERTSTDGRAHVSPDVITSLATIAASIADEIADCDDAVVALQDLATADAYTLQHCVDVTALGLLLGRRLLLDRGWIDARGERRHDRIDQRLVQLGLGLMLHDIGKLIVPAEVLNKPGKLEPWEWKLVKRHPEAGWDMLSPVTVSPLVRTVVRAHHERWDGSGYPDAKAGKDIHEFARIAAVADVYDAVTSERPYSPASDPHTGWRIVTDGVGTAFDPEIVGVFRRVVAPYPPGSEIVLEDGRRGIVVSVPLDRLDAPRVRVGWNRDGREIEPYELDLGAVPAAA